MEAANEMTAAIGRDLVSHAAMSSRIGAVPYAASELFFANLLATRQASLAGRDAMPKTLAEADLQPDTIERLAVLVEGPLDAVPPDRIIMAPARELAAQLDMKHAETAALRLKLLGLPVGPGYGHI